MLAAATKHRLEPDAKNQTGEARYNAHYAVGFGVLVLVFITPFGGESTAGWAMFLHRTLLFAVAGLCLAGLGNRETRDFGIAAYGLLGATLLTMFSSIWIADRAPFDGFYVWYHHLLFAVFFVLLARFASAQSTAWKSTLLAGVVSVTVAHCAWSLISETPPLLGAFINTNYFGSYLLVGFASALAMAARHAGLRWRILAGASAILLLYGITQTLSRGALLAAMGVTVLAVYKMSLRIKLAAAVALMVILVGFSPQLINKFTDLGTSDPYNYMRPKIWSSTLSMVGENPMLGVGLEAYQDVASRFPFATEGTVGRYARRHKMAHSEYLHYAAELGIPGAVLLVTLLAYFFLGMGRARSRQTGEEACLTEAGFLAAGGVGAQALVDNNFSIPVVAAVLTVVALAQVPMPRYSFLRLPSSLEAKTAFALVVAFLFVHSTLVPSLATHFNESGQWAFRAAQFEEAERDHRRAVALAPNHPLLLANLGTMYVDRFARTGDAHWLDAADAFFSRAVNLNPDHIVALRQRHVVLSLKLNAATKEPNTGYASQLIQNSREILRVDPISVFVRRNLAEALYSSGQQAEAFEELRRAIDLEPNFVPAYRRLADWHEAAGRLSESQSLRREADRIMAELGNSKNMNGYEIDLLGLREPKATAELEQRVQ
jgi:O-antigen ligase